MFVHLGALFLSLIFIIPSTNGVAIDFDIRPKYTVLRLCTVNERQFQVIRELFNRSTDLKINFWKTPRGLGDVTDVMVPEESLAEVMQLLNDESVNSTVIISDVEKLIIDRQRKSGQGFWRRLHDDKNTGSYNFDTYGSYDKMVSWMRTLAKKFPSIVQFISIGKSHENRSINGLEIGGGTNVSKRVFWIDGGIHAREWASPHTALYFIHQLTSKYGRDDKITAYVNALTWVIVPCLNPDGYEFTRSSTNPNVRLWRKNRSPTICRKDQWGRKHCCRGVDLNRNFDFHFKESGSSDDPCSEIYQGETAFSEPEARAVRDAVLSNRYRGRIDGFITLHTYSQIWIHPYGHRRDTYPGDIQDLYEVGKKATSALGKLYGTRYVVGSGADTLYAYKTLITLELNAILEDPASGGSEDWAKQHAAIKYVYLLELRPDERNWDGFILDEAQLIPTATETWAGIRVVADALIQRANKKHGSPQKNAESKETESIACYDLRHACKRWITENQSLCRTVRIFMKEQCAQSCGFC